MIARSRLLRGDLFGRRSPVRPPWAIPESNFTDLCTRCDACEAACAQSIIHRGDGGYPQIDFSQRGCTFCGDCVKACQSGALRFTDDPALRPWNLRVEVGQGCLSLQGIVCRTCGESCEESAIRFQLQVGGCAIPLVNDKLCCGCGSCVGDCPIKAIRIRPLSAMEGRQSAA